MIKNVPHLTVDEALPVVVDRISALSAATAWVGIDGMGGSGKTSFAARLVELLPAATVIHVDDFFRPGVDGWDRAGFVREIVEPIRLDRPGRYRRWDWTAETEGEWLTVRPGGVLIIEGVSATDVRLGIDWDLTVWLDVPADVRWRRVMERDGEAFRDRWLNDWIPSEQAYQAAQHPEDRVDLIVVTPT